MKQEKTPNKGKLKNAIAKTPETMVQKTSTKGLKKQLNAENQEKSKVNKNQTPMKKKGPVTPVNGFSKQNGSPVKKGQENQGTPGNKKGKGQNQGAQVQNVNGQQKKFVKESKKEIEEEEKERIVKAAGMIPVCMHIALEDSLTPLHLHSLNDFCMLQTLGTCLPLLSYIEDHLIHICMKGKKKTGQDDEDDEDDDDDDDEDEEKFLFVFSVHFSFLRFLIACLLLRLLGWFSTNVLLLLIIRLCVSLKFEKLGL
ncbi:hypothetical protein RUM43_015042 [Polyplax serrata]|uniref:Uncharacterized protein n=1 Tax=Polyplax serrata TaxID=468196 RepID=A0AAN8P0Q6_POLSC